MKSPLGKFKSLKNRSWGEIRTRGEQAFSVYAERIGLSGKLPTDEEFQQLLDRGQFKNTQITKKAVYEKFLATSTSTFFPSFRRIDETAKFFRHFGGDGAENIIEKANRIMTGKFDLLGYSNLDFGAPINWHFEPFANKYAPLKHWKQFDELDATETGDKKIIWELNRHQHFFTLGVAFQLSRNEEYAGAFVRHLESWMEQNPPGLGINWVSSLEVAFRAISWIWAFNLFKDSENFTPEIFQKAARFLYSHGQHIEKYLSTYYSPNTHLTGEALGLYYLGTQFPFFQKANHWRKLGDEILMTELDRQILTDGVYFEQTTWYQRYTVDFYTHFVVLKKIFAENNDEASSGKLEAKVQSAMDFLMYVTRPDGTTPIIGDDDGGRILPLTSAPPDDFRGTLAVGAVLFERGDYKFICEKIGEETIWLFGKQGAESFQKLSAQLPVKKSVSFKDGGYYVLRDGWAKTDNYLLVDCGAVGSLAGGHGHADTLSIELAIHGKTILIDSGTYSYHESKEMRDYFRSTAAHNALTIDEKSSSETGEKFNWKNRAEATLNSWISEDRFDFFAGSHDGYKNIAADYERSVLFLKNDYWIMRDCAKTFGEHEYAVNFHFDSRTNPVIEENAGGRSFLEVNGQKDAEKQRFFTFGDNGAWHHKQSPVSNFYGKKTSAPFLQFTSKGNGVQEFFTFVLPCENGVPAPEVMETAINGGRAFIIKYLNYSDLFVFTDTEGQVLRTEIFNSDFRFLWARLNADEQIPEEFVMISGARFSIGKREIINHPNNLEFAAARRIGNRLNVKTNEGLFSISLPQKRTSTFVLKNYPDDPKVR